MHGVDNVRDSILNPLPVGHRFEYAACRRSHAPESMELVHGSSSHRGSLSSEDR